MRALRVVGITEGGDVVLEDSGRRERFTVPADEQLRAAARGDLTRLGQIAIELESQLRPREIQARIRAGASVEQVASAAGVPVQKIERFAYPVLLERSRTADVAQRAHPVRDEGPDVRTLGDVVAHTFGLRGQEYSEAEWDSWKGEDGKWLIALSWRAGRSDNRAHWTFQPGAHGGTVTAVDEAAGDLVEGLPARPLRPVGPVIDIARPEEPEPAPQPAQELRATASDPMRERRMPADRMPADRTTGDRTAGDRPVAERPVAERPVAERPAVDQPPAPAAPAPPRADAPVERSAPAAPPAQRRSDAPPRPPVPREESAPAEPAPVAEPPTPASDGSTTSPAGHTTADDTTAEAPAPREPAPAETPPATGRRTRKGKPVMPSWDEVLLGVRGQR